MAERPADGVGEDNGRPGTRCCSPVSLGNHLVTASFTPHGMNDGSIMAIGRTGYALAVIATRAVSLGKSHGRFLQALQWPGAVRNGPEFQPARTEVGGRPRSQSRAL